MLTLYPIADLTPSTYRGRWVDGGTMSALLEAWPKVAKLSPDDEVDPRLGDLLTAPIEGS